jgi:hypothetical protein
MAEAQAQTDMEMEERSGIRLSGLMADAAEHAARMANYHGGYDEYGEFFGLMDDYSHHPNDGL